MPASERTALIDHDPRIRGGRPLVAGTGITVQRIVAWQKLGLSPEQIAARVGGLTFAQVRAALAYYQAHHDEIEAELAREDAEAEAIEAEHLSRSR